MAEKAQSVAELRKELEVLWKDHAIMKAIVAQKAGGHGGNGHEGSGHEGSAHGHGRHDALRRDEAARLWPQRGPLHQLAAVPFSPT